MTVRRLLLKNKKKNVLGQEKCALVMEKLYASNVNITREKYDSYPLRERVCERERVREKVPI